MPAYKHIPEEVLRELYLHQRLSSRKIAKLFGCAYTTIDTKIRLAKFPIRNLAEAHIIYPRKNFSGDLIEKAYLIGFRIGDLRVRKFYKNSETILVGCGSTRKEQIDLIEKLFSKYGRVWIGKPSKSSSINIECHLNNSFEFLLKPKLEKWIARNKKYFLSFLAGFTDAEGCISVSNGQAFYSLGNYDIELLKKIKYLLEVYDIKTHKITCSFRKGLLAQHGYRYNHDYWTLRISRKKVLMKLFALLESHLKHAKRLECLKRARENIILRNQLYGE